MLKNTNSPLGLAGLVIASGLFFGGSATAEARDHGSVSLRFGGPSYCAPAYERVYVPGHYETRYQTVLVEPAHYERRWIPDTFETRADQYGRRFTVCVRRGYWEEYLAPARYENRAVNVWVPGYYQDVAVGSPRSRFDIGAFFRF